MRTERTLRRRLAALTELASNLMLLARVQEGADEIVLREVPIEPVVREVCTRWADAASARGVPLSAFPASSPVAGVPAVALA